MLLLAACITEPARAQQPANEDLLVTGFPGLPADARAVAERLASCSHFAGEIDGDGSERDREVFSTMDRLQCDRVDQDALAIRRKYPRDRAVQEALTAASEL